MMAMRRSSTQGTKPTVWICAIGDGSRRQYEGDNVELTVAGDDAILRISGDDDYTDCNQM